MSDPAIADPFRPSARIRRSLAIFGVLSVLALAGVVAMLAAAGTPPVVVQQGEVVNVFPHDPGAFCQGLVYEDGRLFEGTGQYGESSLREVDLKTGAILRKVDLSDKIFAEGITLWNGTLVQLTWRERRAYTFDRDTFAHLKTFRYSGEGWGLTHDGTHLIMSDGTSVLRFLDPETFQEVRRLPVHEGRRRIGKLNELEFVRGEIYANIWYEDRIVRISPKDGRVLGWIDLHTLWPARQRPSKEHVLNGIAYDAEGDRLFVTGKNWPHLYEIRTTDR